MHAYHKGLLRAWGGALVGVGGKGPTLLRLANRILVRILFQFQNLHKPSIAWFVPQYVAQIGCVLWMACFAASVTTTYVH